jgi:hypothetical protein
MQFDILGSLLFYMEFIAVLCFSSSLKQSLIFFRCYQFSFFPDLVLGLGIIRMPLRKTRGSVHVVFMSI